jgi:polysaccharide deacetylase 2 family uncharacterized protein YibQ
MGRITHYDRRDVEGGKLRTPEEGFRLETLMEELDNRRLFLVDRRVIATTRRQEFNDVSRRFDDVVFSVLANSAAEAAAFADELKYNREVELGHHRGGHSTR